MVVNTEYINTRGKRNLVFLIELKDVGYVANLIKQSYEENKYDMVNFIKIFCYFNVNFREYPQVLLNL